MGSTTSSLFERLRELIADTLLWLENPGAVTRDAKLAELGMDSLSGLDLLLAMEEEFEVRFPQELLTATTFDTCESLEAALKSLGAS